MRLDLFLEAPAPGLMARLSEASSGLIPVWSPWSPMTLQHPERLALEHRLRRSPDYAAVKAGGTGFRGRFVLLLVLPRPGEATRVGFVASKKSVGGSVQRNRARRRLREIVRRRWPRLPHEGYWMMFIASRGVLAAPHQALASEVEHLLASAGALAPIVAGS